ncbi:MAG: zeta toxin family protein [Verrucomicrobia bacterium]|nr:zeta toxin family protein [Verrucomicrobiota bacterium]
MNFAQPFLLAFCGPNGAGKSTLRRITLGDRSISFVDPDRIADEVFGQRAAEHANDAAQIAEFVRAEHFRARRSFGFETVLSDPAGEKVRFLRQARDAGYFVVVHFVGLDSPERSRARVIQRVNEGGHDVPDDKLSARYPRVMDNLRRLLDVPDDLVIYDNSSADAPYRVIARLSRGALLELTGAIPAWAQRLELPARQTAQTRILP